MGNEIVMTQVFMDIPQPPFVFQRCFTHTS